MSNFPRKFMTATIMAVVMLAHMTTAQDWTASSITITTEAQLRQLAALVNDGTRNFTGQTVTLANDIEITNGEWVPIGFSTKKFNGTFNGNGNVVKGINISAANKTDGLDNVNLGFFGISSGNIKNLGVFVDITGKYSVGGLLGVMDGGTITNCYADGRVVGGQNIGGLVGSALSGTIENCHVLTNVSGTESYTTGGLVGANTGGDISKCYSLGSLTGINGGTISWCYSVGKLSAIESGSASNSLGNRTEAQMKQRTTYSAFGFDFNNIWQINDEINDGYPYLRVLRTSYSPTKEEMPECVNETGWKFCNGTLTVSENIDYDPNIPYYPNYTNYGYPWDKFRKFITTVVIENGVTAIGYSAFSSCRLTSVTIPNSVTSIGDRAFSNCGLTSVTIPNSVTTIGELAFGGCSITSLTIPNSVTTIGERAFENYNDIHNYSLEEINIGSSLISLDAFSYNMRNYSALKSINVAPGNKVYSSEDGVLFYKTKAELIRYPAGKTNTNYTIPSSVTRIEEYAFYGCKSLTSINIPSSVTSISGNAFNGCESLTSIDVDVNNKKFSSENGVLFNKGKTELISCPEGKTGAYTIPNSVTTIGSFSYYCGFYGCSGLTSVTIPKSVTTIENGAFARCSSLTKITNLATTPQGGLSSWNPFYGLDKSSIKLRVPAEAMYKYLIADVWKDFDIIEYDGIDDTPISISQKSDKKHGIVIEKNPVTSDFAEIKIKTPEKSEVKLTVYDNIGNVVYETMTRDGKVMWNLTNSAGRNVANGSYLVVAEVKGVSGKTYRYSAKLGVKR